MKVETGPPAAVTQLTGTGHGTAMGATDGIVNLAWIASTATDLDKYEVYRSDDGGVTWNLTANQPGDGTGIEDSGLTVGETYRYKVVSVDWVGEKTVDAATAPPGTPDYLKSPEILSPSKSSASLPSFPPPASGRTSSSPR